MLYATVARAFLPKLVSCVHIVATNSLELWFVFLLVQLGVWYRVGPDLKPLKLSLQEAWNS